VPKPETSKLFLDHSVVMHNLPPKSMRTKHLLLSNDNDDKGKEMCIGLYMGKLL